ncbi:MAG: excinuclease ATPase subunit [Gammaproteobacteria bacterium]|nr:excinuclease ATPase subunit [Gammaproteobacteria bacterium]
MKGFVTVFMSVVVILGAVNVEARDDRKMWSISEALNVEDAKQKLNQGIRFYFGDQSHPKITKNYGEFMSNKKTNAFNKTDERACQWNFLSAMISFQERAQRMGGNAVVNIRSFYKRNEISSQTEFECASGAFVSGVTFLGDVVKLAE